MNGATLILTVHARNILLLVAVLVALVPLSLRTDNAVYAQSDPTFLSSVSDAPTISVVSASAIAVELSWTAVSEAASYDLRAWWAGADGWQRIDGDRLTTVSFAHRDVAAGTKYFYIVAGVDSGGRRGPWSAQVEVAVPSTDVPTSTPTSSQTPTVTATATPGAGTPTPTPSWTATASAPSTPTLTAKASAHGIILIWQAVPNAVRYELLTWWAKDPGWQPIGGDSLTSTSYTHTTVTGGTNYFYTFRAVYASGEASGWLLEDLPSTVALSTQGAVTSTPTPTHTTTPVEAPAITPTQTATPTALAVPYLTVRATERGVELRWHAVLHATRYELLTWWAKEPGWQPIGGDNLTATSYTHTTVTASTTYHYSIRAVNAAGDSSPWLIGDFPSATALATFSGTSTPTPSSTATAAATPTVTPTPATTERGALIALYQATDGANWRVNDNWLSDEPLATWYGVSTDNSGRVTDLNLGENRLRGSLPDLSALSNLITLSLYGNELSGPIPDLSAFFNLDRLDLLNNELSGPIPDLSALSNLRTLSFSDNQLSGPIPDLSALSKLDWLNLSYNKLSGPIPDLGALSQLRLLKLSYNELSGPIPNLSALSKLESLILDSNELSGPVPDLSAIPELRTLFLSKNELSGPIPDLNALSKLVRLDLSENNLSGSIPVLSALSELRVLYLQLNQLSGLIPDLNALTELVWLDLQLNRLSGPIPDLSALTELKNLTLNENELSGPIPDLSVHPRLEVLELRHNQLTGPVPDVSGLSSLYLMDLTGNRLCVIAGVTLSHPHRSVANYLSRLNLPTCTSAELSLVPPAIKNLTATVDAGHVTLRWDAAADAADYDLWSWNSLDRRWGSVGGALAATTFKHPVLTDGRNYYFRVRARSADGVRGAWSLRTQAIIVPQRFPSPPPSLGLDIFYQKYLQVAGVVVVAPTEVSDEKMEQAGAIVAAMLSGKPALLESAAPKYIRIAIYHRKDEEILVGQLPEFRYLSGGSGGEGRADWTASGWIAAVPDKDREYCYAFIHEFAHTIQLALEYSPGGEEFRSRLEALYNAAMNADLWQNTYASTNVWEYWAETVTFWFHEFMREPHELRGSKLEDYDPEIARLISETFGEEAYVPDYCKP